MKSRLFYLAKFMNEKSSYDHDRLLYHHLSKQVSAAYIKEYRLRSLFRTFLHRWRIRRMDRRYTKEIDPITLSEPEKEVFVYDQRANKKFVFEAKSISHVVETAFLYHEGGFAIPHMPRNPWTNLEFSYAQLISIYYQLKHHNELGWCLHTLREYNFDKTMWHLYHHSTITMTAIKTSLRLLDSLDARELLEDFIFSKMEELEIHTTSSIQSAYRLAILKVPRHWYLEQCKQIAYLHYESQHFNRNRLQLINQKCKQLFKKQSIFLKDLVQQRVISHI
jgi:hypothetical protein